MTMPVDMSPANSAWSCVRRTRAQDRDSSGALLRLSGEITATFLEDDDLFIQRQFSHFRLNFGYDPPRSNVKGEVCSEMHSSRNSGRLPKAHQQHVTSGAYPQRPAEPVLRSSNCVPMPAQFVLCEGFDTIAVDYPFFS
jgi:hypothetical protein